jgi:hypothetical protein
MPAVVMRGGLITGAGHRLAVIKLLLGKGGYFWIATELKSFGAKLKGTSHRIIKVKLLV